MRSNTKTQYNSTEIVIKIAWQHIADIIQKTRNYWLNLMEKVWYKTSNQYLKLGCLHMGFMINNAKNCDVKVTIMLDIKSG